MSTATVAGRRRISPRRVVKLAVRRMSPRLRRRLAALALVTAVLAAGYQFWLRDSSLVSVEQVRVTGLTTSDAAKVRAALTSAGKTMTTLHLNREALERAVVGYPVVRALEVQADFPHGLHVRVIEYQPVAIAVGDTGRVPVAGDGTILRGLEVEGRLPTVDVDGPLGDETLLDLTASASASVAGQAPAALRPRIQDVQARPGEGYVAQLRDGPELIFGPATRLRAKWAAAVRVLADLEARGASYVDLRIPSRPAVGGLAATTLAPVAPADAPLGAAPAGTTPTGIEQTPDAAAIAEAVPNTASAEPEAPATTTPADTTEPVVPAPTEPTTPTVTQGTEGGAVAAP